MKRILMFAATATAVLIISTGTAVAAGQQFCVGAPSGAVYTPDSDGQCKRDTTLITLPTEQDLSALEARVSALETANSTLESKVSALEDKLSKVSYDETGLNDKPTLTIDGANLQLVDGSGTTGGATNSLGNLFIGYDEHSDFRAQTGSHNLVLGTGHEFTSYGGLLAGASNTATAPSSSVLGWSNTASGRMSSVSGGYTNTASGDRSSVSGGLNNTASDSFSSVSGGASNTASADFSSVSGGGGNIASGSASSILGGNRVTVIGEYGTSP